MLDGLSIPLRFIVASSSCADGSYCSQAIARILETESSGIGFDEYVEHNLTDAIFKWLQGSFVADMQMRPHSNKLNACRDESLGVIVMWRNLAHAVTFFDENVDRFGSRNAMCYVDRQLLAARPRQDRYRYIVESIVPWNVGFYLNWRWITDIGFFS